MILARLEELHQLWELLLKKLSEKGLKLQQALVLVQYFRYLLSKTYLPSIRQSIIVKLGDKEQIGVKEPFPVTKCQFTS